MRAPGAGPSAHGRSTDWRFVATETAGFARRIGVVPVLVLFGAVGAVVAVGFLAGVRHGSPEPIELPLAADEAPLPVATTQASLLKVHLAGAVQRPGLYEVPGGSRVNDLVDAAGGLDADADRAAVNLAARLSDEQQIYVPVKGELPAAGTAGSDPSGPIDVNTATAAQLDELPGIGPSLAAAIIAFRSEHGPFATLDALEQVPGIGPAKLSRLRPHAAV